MPSFYPNLLFIQPQAYNLDTHGEAQNYDGQCIEALLIILRTMKTSLPIAVVGHRVTKQLVQVAVQLCLSNSLTARSASERFAPWKLVTKCV